MDIVYSYLTKEYRGNKVETINNYLTRPIYCTQDTRIAEVRYLLKKYENDEILVLDSAEEGHPVGMIKFSDTEIAPHDEHLPYDESAQELMTELSTVVRPDTSVEVCLDIMREKKLDSIVVVNESGQLRGVVKKQDIIHRILH